MSRELVRVGVSPVAGLRLLFGNVLHGSDAGLLQVAPITIGSAPRESETAPERPRVFFLLLLSWVAGGVRVRLGSVREIAARPLAMIGRGFFVSWALLAFLMLGLETLGLSHGVMCTAAALLLSVLGLMLTRWADLLPVGQPAGLHGGQAGFVLVAAVTLPLSNVPGLTWGGKRVCLTRSPWVLRRRMGVAGS